MSAAPVFAQDDTTTPPTFCGDLDEADCSILETSTEAMQNVSSYALDAQYTFAMSGFPDMPADEIGMAFTMDGSWAMDEAARSAASAMNALARGEPPADPEVAAEEMRQSILDLYQGLAVDLSFTVTTSDELADAITAESDVPFPPELSFGVRMVDGMAYINLADLRPLIPELDSLTSDWIGIDMVGMLEMSMAQGDLETPSMPGATDSAVAGAVYLQMVKLLEQFVTIERLDDVQLADQEGAVFVYSFDLVEFFRSDEFSAFATQIAESGALGEEAPSPQEIEEGLAMLALFSPVAFRDLVVESQVTIGLEDYYTYDTAVEFSWDLTSLLQLAAMSDDNLREALEPGQSPEFTLTFDGAYSDFNQEMEIEAPEDVEIIPLDQMTPQTEDAVF